MKVGDKVTWIYESRAGYGFVQSVAAVLLSEGPVRVQIKIAQKDPLTGEWVSRTRWVNREKLLPRITHVPEVDDTPNPAIAKRK